MTQPLWGTQTRGNPGAHLPLESALSTPLLLPGAPRTVHGARGFPCVGNSRTPGPWWNSSERP
eukprot:2367659-Pyramimonas_sp.AAC.1